MINDCRISGRDLYHIDEGLLRQMELPQDVATYVLQAIDDLRYNKVPQFIVLILLYRYY